MTFLLYIFCILIRAGGFNPEAALHTQRAYKVKREPLYEYDMLKLLVWFDREQIQGPWLAKRVEQSSEKQFGLLKIEFLIRF